MVTEQEDANNKEYAEGYGSGRSSDIVQRTISESPFGLDRDSIYYKGYEAGVKDQHDHGYQSADDCGTGETPSDSCCYIVSACLDDLKLPRACLEMSAMKRLTKDHILKSFGGRRDYVRYGKIGPRIVSSIRASSNPQVIWRRIYDSLGQLVPTVEQGNLQEGYDRYKSLVISLEAQFAK